MDVSILRKRLNTYKSGKKGTLRNVGDEVVIDVLRAWEHWPGSAADLYRELGLSKMQLVTMIQKGKRLVKNGIVTESEFSEIALPVPSHIPSDQLAIELCWDGGRVIRFAQVEQLLEFLKKVA